MAREFTAGERRRWLRGLPSLPAGAVVLLEDSNERLLVVKANYRPYWTPPGGVIDEDESPKQAAARELKEETGLDIAPDTLNFIGVHYRMRDTYLFIFGAPTGNSVVPEAIILQESEIEAYDFVTKAQVTRDRKIYSSPIVAWATNTLRAYSETDRRPV